MTPFKLTSHYKLVCCHPNDVNCICCWNSHLSKHLASVKVEYPTEQPRQRKCRSPEDRVKSDVTTQTAPGPADRWTNTESLRRCHYWRTKILTGVNHAQETWNETHIWHSTRVHHSLYVTISITRDSQLLKWTFSSLSAINRDQANKDSRALITTKVDFQ